MAGEVLHTFAHLVQQHFASQAHSLYSYSLHKQYVSYASLLVARMQTTYFLLARKLVAQVKVMVTSLKENFQKLKFKPNKFKIQKLCNTVRIISLAQGLESGRIDAF